MIQIILLNPSYPEFATQDTTKQWHASHKFLVLSHKSKIHRCLNLKNKYELIDKHQDSTGTKTKDSRGKTKDTDAKVNVLEQKGKSDGSNPIGVKNE